jgi:hypothetical protein
MDTMSLKKPISRRDCISETEDRNISNNLVCKGNTIKPYKRGAMQNTFHEKSDEKRSSIILRTAMSKTSPTSVPCPIIGHRPVAHINRPLINTI